MPGQEFASGLKTQMPPSILVCRLRSPKCAYRSFSEVSILSSLDHPTQYSD